MGRAQDSQASHRLAALAAGTVVRAAESSPPGRLIDGGWVPQGASTGSQPTGSHPAGFRPAGRTESGLPGAPAARRAVPLRAAVAAVAVAVAVLVGGAVRVLVQQPEVVTVPPRGAPVAGAPSAVTSPVTSLDSPDGPLPPARPPVGTAAGLPAGSIGQVVVDVVGQVRRPGVQHLPAGSRVADAISAAGGVTRRAEVQRVNLARLVVDGEQIVVPAEGDPPGAGAPAAPGASAPGAAGTGAATPLDLNAAGVTELDTLPGLGPVLAGRIVEWRTAHGRFSRVEELGEVPGIGPTLLERLRPLVRV